MPSKRELLQQLRDEVAALMPGDVSAAEHLRRRVLMILSNLYGDARKPYRANVMNVRFDSPRIASEATRGSHGSFIKARDRLLSILSTAIEEEELFPSHEELEPGDRDTGSPSDSVREERPMEPTERRQMSLPLAFG